MVDGEQNNGTADGKAAAVEPSASKPKKEVSWPRALSNDGKKKTEKPAEKGDDEITGHVTSLRISARANVPVTLEVKGKKGERKSFVLDGGEVARLQAMIAAIVTAQANHQKVRLHVATADAKAMVVSALELRSKK